LLPPAAAQALATKYRGSVVADRRFEVPPEFVSYLA